MNTLLRIQQCFAAALQEPLQGEDRTEAGLTAVDDANASSITAEAAALLCSSPVLEASERLRLYQRQYWFRLLDSLGEDFPNVEKLLGKTRFTAMLEAYLRVEPPSHWSLRKLGAGFAGFLDGDDSLSAEERGWAFDLARFDYAHMDAFDAPAAALPAEPDLVEKRLCLTPTARLLLVNHPLSRFLASDDAKFSAGEIGATPELHLVWRDARNRLRSHREENELQPLLESLRAGGLLDEILDRCPVLPPPELLRDAFKRWRSSDLIALA